MTNRQRMIAFQALTGAALILGAGVTARGDDIRWSRSYSEARAESTRLNKPLVIVVKSPSCGWCTQMDQTTLRDGGVVKALNDTAVALKLDAANPYDRQIIEAMGVTSLPTIAVVSARGLIVANQSGYHDVNQFLTLVRNSLSR